MASNEGVLASRSRLHIVIKRDLCGGLFHCPGYLNFGLHAVQTMRLLIEYKSMKELSNGEKLIDLTAIWLYITG